MLALAFLNVNIQAKLPWDCDETSQMFCKEMLFHNIIAACIFAVWQI